MVKDLFIQKAEDPAKLEELGDTLVTLVNAEDTSKAEIIATLKEAAPELATNGKSKYTLLAKTLFSLFAAAILSAMLTWGGWVTKTTFAMQQAQTTTNNDIRQLESFKKDTKDYIGLAEQKIDIMEQRLMEQRTAMKVIEEKFNTAKYLLETINKTTEENNRLLKR